MKDEQNKFIGTVAGTNGEFKVFRLNDVKMTAIEETRLIFGVTDDDKSSRMRVRRVILTKAKN